MPDAHVGKRYIAAGEPAGLDRMQAEQSMVAQTFSMSDAQQQYWEIGAATVMVHPESTLIGHSLRDLEFRYPTTEGFGFSLRELALEESRLACQKLDVLGDSPYRTALMQLAEFATARIH